MALTGADVQQLRDTAARLTQGAESLETSAKTLTSMVANVATWRGPDADRFRSDWHGNSVPTISSITAQLRDAANTLKRNADQQEGASAAAGAGSAGSVSTDTDGPKSAEDLMTHLHNEAEKDIRIETVVGFRQLSRPAGPSAAYRRMCCVMKKRSERHY